MFLEQVCASRDIAQAELKKLPSCEDLTKWITVVLNVTSPSTELTNLDAKSLLAMVTKENIEITADKKRRELTQMEKMLANKKKKEAQERGQHEKRIASEQLKIQGLMSQLSDLKSELAQQKEVYKALEIQIKTKEAPEIKAEEADTSEEPQATERRRKRTPQAGKSTEKMQATKKKRKSTRSKPTDSQTRVKDDNADKNTRETQQVKTKQLTKSVKEARGPEKKEARGPEKKEARGPEKKEARGPEKKEARGPEKKEARGPEKKEARGPEKKEGRGPREKEGRGPREKEGRGPQEKEGRGPREKKARGPEKNVEKQGSNSQESVGAFGGIRKPPGPQRTAAPRLKSGDSPSKSQLAAPSQGRKQVAMAAGEAHNTVLRRSKRIASRT
ncbi:neurofilament heavy polypeptide [Etheostoma spectabile]|uniref:neurofilament heavy polypeptide n=1 Tax=Etheostoma spectabile TaxID=54343 RepID=UPI0013AF999A|nr:neurofilament heavy polypeptide-like [Etheostoma spectabile]